MQSEEDKAILAAGNITELKAQHNNVEIIDTKGGIEISEKDETASRNFCKAIIKQIVDLRLPKNIKGREELMQIIELQRSFEEFTLVSMFSVVSKAVKMLRNIDIDDVYTPEGVFDPFRLTAQMQLQQHTMNIIMQFSTHVRRLPVVISDMINDVEASTRMAIDVTENTGGQSGNLGSSTSKPLSMLLIEAEADLAKAAEEKADDSDIIEDAIIEVHMNENAVKNEITKAMSSDDIDFTMDE